MVQNSQYIMGLLLGSSPWRWAGSRARTLARETRRKCIHQRVSHTRGRDWPQEGWGWAVAGAHPESRGHASESVTFLVVSEEATK